MAIAVRRLAVWAASLTPLIITTAGHAVIYMPRPTRNGAPAPGSIAETPWSLQGQWGPFLGTPIAPNYFLTAVHVGGDPASTFNFRGTNYTIDASFGSGGGLAIDGSDLRIWKVNETFPAFAPLYGTSFAISSTINETGKHMLVFGRGRCGDEVRTSGDTRFTAGNGARPISCRAGGKYGFSGHHRQLTTGRFCFIQF
jgi:hypothetical protein